mmetsp:Transcript_6344/g.13297  ORF Transcript_6344/g.13297 Transcript_6344/m.13297 type:complete len:256 (+) Transcript_6344:779-1546(+)
MRHAPRRRPHRRHAHRRPPPGGPGRPPRYHGEHQPRRLLLPLRRGLLPAPRGPRTGGARAAPRVPTDGRPRRGRGAPAVQRAWTEGVLGPPLAVSDESLLLPPHEPGGARSCGSRGRGAADSRGSAGLSVRGPEPPLLPDHRGLDGSRCGTPGAAAGDRGKTERVARTGSHPGHRPGLSQHAVLQRQSQDTATVRLPQIAEDVLEGAGVAGDAGSDEGPPAHETGGEFRLCHVEAEMTCASTPACFYPQHLSEAC